MVRNTHGAWAPSLDPRYAYARTVIGRAVKHGRLPRPYVDFDKRMRGACLNLDIYDAAGGAVLVQIRRTTGTKWGLSPRLTYVVVRAVGRGTRVEAVDHPSVIKRMAALDPAPGAILTRLAELAARDRARGA